MERPEETTDRETEELARLADGTLPEARRRELEARVAASPALAERLEEQRRAHQLVRSVAVAAPAGLRERVAGARRRGEPRTRRLALPGAVAAAGAAAAVGVVALVAGGGAARPSVADAAALTALPATAPAPAQSASQPRQVSVRVSGIGYPYWDDAFRWRATGARSDRIEGRRVTTVFYSRGGVRVGYSIVPGAALDHPGGARVVRRGGAAYRLFSAGGRPAVTWERRGHTCVLAGAGVSPGTLLRLAAWRAY
jgi:hypothetical protein